MLNVTVIGTVRDDSGHLQSGSYTVEYKDRNKVVGPITTDNSQISFNIGDHSHLGCTGTMRDGEVVYVEFKNEAGTKFARRRHICSGESVVRLDTISKEDWGLSSLLTVNEIEDGVYRLNSACTGESNTFRIYVCGKGSFNNNPADCDWHLVRIIDTTEDYVDVVFARSVFAKIEAESSTSEHVGNTDYTTLDARITYVAPGVIIQPYTIEWE